MLFIGPMTKNVVDVAIEYSSLHPDVKLTFIPSRRQIEHTGGYVNNWKTREFCQYVKSQNSSIQIERDHGGPGQGLTDDDGVMSIIEDSKYMDIIHIDPWKKYPDLSDGIRWTVALLHMCDVLNPKLQYEIGTEESIRKFTVHELEQFILGVKNAVSAHLFKKIKFVVIQCGTSLKEGVNTGNFDVEKLKSMLELVRKYNVSEKEHNGDWVPKHTKIDKYRIGLRHVNVAPELGETESRVILQHLKSYPEDYNTFFNICLTSEKWKKWVSDDFEPNENKDMLILICGHYVLSHPDVVSIVNKHALTVKIREALFSKLDDLDVYRN